jgi:hypothetical protein
VEPIQGCLSCAENSAVTSEEADQPDAIDQVIERQNRFAGIIGPPPTCIEHGRTPCDVCGASYQPMRVSSAEDDEDKQVDGPSRHVVPIRSGRRLS